MFNTQLRDQLIKWSALNFSTRETHNLAASNKMTKVPLSLVTAEFAIVHRRKHGSLVVKRHDSAFFKCYPIARTNKGNNAVLTLHTSEWR